MSFFKDSRHYFMRKPKRLEVSEIIVTGFSETHNHATRSNSLKSLVFYMNRQNATFTDTSDEALFIYLFIFIRQS